MQIRKLNGQQNNDEGSINLAGVNKKATLKCKKIFIKTLAKGLVHSKWPNSVKFDVQAYYVGTEEDMALKLIFYTSTCQNTCVLKIS